MLKIGLLAALAASLTTAAAAPKKAEPGIQLTEAGKEIEAKYGAITIPAVAHGKPAGQFAAMKSFSGGMQLHCTGGFKAEYAIEVSRAGKYVLAARVATAQEGQKFQLAANDAKAPVEIAVPYTIGMWQATQPVEISLVNGKNVLHFALTDGSRGVTIKEFTLTPVKESGGK